MCALSPQLIDQGEAASQNLAVHIHTLVPSLEQALYAAASSRVRPQLHASSGQRRRTPNNHLIVLQDVYLDRETLKDRLEMVAEWMLRDHLIRQRELQTDLGQLIQALGDVSMAAPRAIDADS